MSRRAYNPMRSVRWGAVVVLACAGTVATLVVSEWPLTGQSIARRAVVRLPASEPVRRQQAQPAIAATPPKIGFMPDEPDAYAYPRLVAAGSSEEQRRQGQGVSPPAAAANRARATFELPDEIDWFAAPAKARRLEQIEGFAPARTGATVPVTSGLEVSGGVTAYNTPDGLSIGHIDFSEPSPLEGRQAEVYDFSVRLDALSAGGIDPGSALNLGAVAGLRAASLYDESLGQNRLRDAAAVVGGDARWRYAPNAMIRASALADAPGTDHDYLDLRVEQVWRFGADAWLSLGWRHMRGILSNERPTPTLRDDSLLLELKLGF